MKKILAVLLSVLMLTSTGVVGAIFVSAADTSGSGAITIDGKFDEPAWAADAWINVNSANANVQTPLKEGEIRKENYDLQFRTDDANLYVAMKFNCAPVATDALNGNGKGTFFRLWTYVDGSKDANNVEYITYNYIFNCTYKPSGDIFTVTKNTNALGNTGSTVTITGFEAKSTRGDNYWYVEMKIPFAGIGATDNAHFYTTLSSPTEIDASVPATSNQPTNNSWAYPKYGYGIEANGNADTMYTEWDKNNDIDMIFADYKIGTLPKDAQKIDNFGDYVGKTTTVLTRVNGKATIGEVSAITFGTAKVYNNFYMASVDATGKVVEINMFASVANPKPAESLKDAVVIPEGGYVLLCSAEVDANTHSQAMIDAFKSIKVGDTIGLYNVDLAALATGATKANIANAGFRVKKADYAKGITLSANAAEVVVNGNKALTTLTDGNKASDANTFENAQVVLFKNLKCTTEKTYPSFDLIYKLDQPMVIDTVNLSFYHEYNSMIGLPKDNKVTISYANDPASFEKLGDYTFEGAAADKTSGVIDANIFLGKSILTSYIKITMSFGDGPWASATPSKPIWEFIGLTEIGVSATYPVGVTNVSSSADVGILNNKALTSLSDGVTALADKTKKHNDVQVVAFQNLKCATAGTYPTVELIYNIGKIKTLDTLKITFYHDYNVMIGLPKDNKVSVSYSNEPSNFVSLGDYTFEGKAEGGVNDVLTANLKLNTPVKAKYLKIAFNFGDSPFASSSKPVWEFIGMTDISVLGYNEGVTNNSASSDVGVLNGRSVRVLTDGNKALNLKTFKSPEVFVLQNKKTATAGVYPTVDLILTLPMVTQFDAIKLGFYHEYDSMIGLPKDNKVSVSYANNYNSFSTPVDLTFEGAAAAKTSGVIDATLRLGETVKAKYVRIQFKFGDSPFASSSKPVWEFIALTEFGVSDSSDPVSTGKTYTGSTAARSGWTDTDPKTKLTDGNVGTLATLGSNGPFVGFQVVKNEEYTYTSGAWVGAGTYTYAPDERDENGNFNTVIDLGESISDLKVFTAKFGQITAWGVFFPTKVTFSASEDGTTFTSIGEAKQGRVENNGAATLKEWADYTLIANAGVKARYIKIEIKPYFEFPDITAPTTTGKEGDKVTQTKAIVTAISEITVGFENMSAGVVYSDKAPVTTDYAYNVALNKDWFGIDYHATIPQYDGDFTDGVYAEGNNFSYKSPWFSFYRNASQGNIDENMYGEVIIDLGSDGTGLGALRMQVAPSIGEAEYIKVYASNTGITWDEVGTVTYTGTNIQWATCTFEKTFDARYIKVAIQNKGMFFMVSEIEVIKYIPSSTFSVDFANQYSVGYQNPTTWTYNGGETLAGVGDAVYIYTPDKGKTLGEAANQGIAWWQVWTIDWDSSKNCYYIKAFYPVNNGSPKKDIEIPEKGFVVASCGHGNLAFDSILTTDAAIGAPVYVYGMDILNLGVKDTMDFVKTNTISVFAPIEGKTPYVPNFSTGLPEGAIIINNFGDYVVSTISIYTRVNDKTTLGEVAAVTFGESKVFNMFYLVAVDSTGKVVAINQTIDADKKDESKKDSVVIPEGGYLLLCSSSAGGTLTQAMIDAFKAIKVGDTITLHNVDLQALAAGATKANLNTAGFTVTEGTPVVDPLTLKDPDNTSVQIKDGFLLGITDKMTVEDIKALFAGEVTVEGVGTGKKVTAGDKSIVIIILGDLNGDGKINSLDAFKVKKAIIRTYTLTDLELKAACISGAEKPTRIDYMRMKKHAIGTYNIFGQNAQG